MAPPKSVISAPKFVFAVRKIGKADLARARGHNCRTHTTASQLPKEAWFSKAGHHTFVRWQEAQAERARGLAKRKDAVVGIEMVIQVGNQTDWREPPTKAHPHGEPKEWLYQEKDMARAVYSWACVEFGKQNIVSLELHTDESTPHFQLVVTPERDGKLQAKHWLDGAASVAALRKRCHEAVRQACECDYERGAPGGEPHDPSQAAGQQPAPGLIAKLLSLKKLGSENRTLKKRVADLEQARFSRAKTGYSALKLRQADKIMSEAEKTQQKADAALQEALKRERMASTLQADAVRWLNDESTVRDRLAKAETRAISAEIRADELQAEVLDLSAALEQYRPKPAPTEPIPRQRQTQPSEDSSPGPGNR